MEYRIIQDGLPVAWATSLTEIAHYAAVYALDGPVVVQERPDKGRWRTVRTKD
jgi:hypothetical protein